MERNRAGLGKSFLLTAIVLVAAAGTALAAGESLVHNSNNLGTKYGTWGVAGGTYGEFTCSTCHSTPTDNIKRIVQSVPNTVGPNVNKPVVFNNMTGFGYDSAGRTTSFRICEVCHTQTKYHRYDTTGQTDLTHPNGDCSGCHPHAEAFKAKSCSECHGHNATSSSPIATGQHSAHMNSAALLGTNYSCADCHAPTVSSDTAFSNAANHDQSKQNPVLPGNPDVNYGGTRAGTFSAGTCTAYCHSDGKGGAPATAVNWTSGPSLDCKGCHGGGGSVAGEPAYGAGNSHAKHVSSAADCVSCHFSTTADGVSVKAGGTHTNMSVDVNGGTSIGFDDGAKTCSTASCHKNPYASGSVTTPNWGATAAECTACHSAYPIKSTGPQTGSHVKHNTTDCTQCHASGTSATTMPSTGHMNDTIDVTGGYPATAKHAAGTYAGSCSAASCHNNPYGTGSVATPIWGATAAECTACHSAYPIKSSGPQTGSHVAHTGKACISCHAAGTSATTIPSTGHNDGTITVTVGSYPATAKHAAGTYTGTCSNVSCHNGGGLFVAADAQWGSTLGCDGCHGDAATTGPSQLSGKHLAHTSAPVSIDCNQCHLNGGTNNGKVNHGNTLINYSSQWAGTVSLADGKCNNVYCHSNGKGTFVNMSNANWFSARTLDCKGCHGGASSQAGEPSYLSGVAGSYSANSHPKHVGTAGADAKCQNCHSKTVSGVLLNASTHKAVLGGYTRAISYHADQSLNDSNAGVYSGNGKTFTYTAVTKTCSNISCHSGSGLIAGVADAQWGASFSCESCHGGNASATNKITSGQHGKHTDQATVLGVNFGCVECHAQTVSNDSTLKAGNITHMNAMANFSGAKSGTNKASCSTAYCHSDGKGGAGATAVSWTAGPALDCKGCHGGATSQAGEPVYTSTAPGTLKTNSHPKHVGTTGADATCQNCHGSTMNGNVLGNTGNHLNGSITVLNGNNKTFTYSNDSTKTCSNISCHSGGGMFTAADAQWGATMPADCTGCHGNEVTAATKLSGAHDAHMNSATTGGSFKCKDCHAPTITSADNRTITNANNHGNTLINFSGAKAGNNKNCSNIYCHSNGKGAFAAIPTWTSGTNLDCQGCHATAALQFDHTTHLAKGASCNQCHNLTTTDNATIAGATHIDGSVNLQAGGTFGAKSVAFSPSTTTCSNISCHSPYGTPVNSATWGVASTCETCHPKAGLSGAHAVHIGALNLTSSTIYYNMTANRTPVQNDTVKTHGFGCANCHPMNANNHLNGTIDVDMSSKGVAGISSIRFLNSTTAGSLPQYSGGSCGNIYCHSNASRVTAELVYKPTPTWVGGSFSGDRCANCHDNQPATGAHAAHAVGNHYENIYTGKVGKVATSNRANTAHGNPNNSTTIGCYICHNATVTSKANDNNTKCIGCHFAGNSVGAELKGAATIANLKNHVNGSREIQFLPIQVKSKAQIRPESFKFYSGVWVRTTYKNMTTLSYDSAKVALDTATMWHPSTPMESNCSNIACHNGKPVKWNLANWNDPNKCMDCHNAL